MEIRTETRRRRNLSGWLVNLLCAVTGLYALGLVVPTALGLERYVITGTSMGGSMSVGSLVFSEVVPLGDLRVGDVITYLPPAESGLDTLVTHRIIRMKGDLLQTKGDTVGQPDPWVFHLEAPMQARVRFAVPYAGYPLLAMQDRRLRILVVGVPAGLIALLSLGQAAGALRRRPEAPSRADDENGTTRTSRATAAVEG
ncbi:signal peptidase I [Nocardioides sp. GCM10027113]|uniref:signal peptidase I n=1 Tax=unclassified Nocardioides TaxID=2615069 RepID=UPI0036166EAB